MTLRFELRAFRGTPGPYGSMMSRERKPRAGQNAPVVSGSTAILAAMELDLIAGRVHGAVQAKDVRIVYRDGVLYVCTVAGQITAYEATEPQRRGSYYIAQVGGRNVTWQPPGCGSCRRRVKESKVGQMSVDEIVASASVSA